MGLMDKQMQAFALGGLKDEGGEIDEASGNRVPIGGTKEGVRDDIPANVSEGEFVMPADVVRYHGLDKMMALRQEAKMGLKQMDAMGQMGNSDEATMPDDLPFEMADLIVVGGQGEPMEFANGGFVPQMQTLPTAPVPTMGGPTGNVTPIVYDDFAKAPVVTMQEYRNAAGESLIITYVNGKATTEIPAGYSLYTPPANTAPSTAQAVIQAANNYSYQTSGGGDEGPDTPRELQVDPDYASMDNSTLFATINEQNSFGVKAGKTAASAIALTLAGPFGLLSMNAMNADARKLEQLGYDRYAAMPNGSEKIAYGKTLSEVYGQKVADPKEKNALVKFGEGILSFIGLSNNDAKAVSTQASEIVSQDTNVVSTEEQAPVTSGVIAKDNVANAQTSVRDLGPDRQAFGTAGLYNGLTIPQSPRAAGSEFAASDAQNLQNTINRLSSGREAPDVLKAADIENARLISQLEPVLVQKPITDLSDIQLEMAKRTDVGKTVLQMIDGAPKGNVVPDQSAIASPFGNVLEENQGMVPAPASTSVTTESEDGFPTPDFADENYKQYINKLRHENKRDRASAEVKDFSAKINEQQKQAAADRAIQDQLVQKFPSARDIRRDKINEVGASRDSENIAASERIPAGNTQEYYNDLINKVNIAKRAEGKPENAMLNESGLFRPGMTKPSPMPQRAGPQGTAIKIPVTQTDAAFGPQTDAGALDDMIARAPVRNTVFETGQPAVRTADLIPDWAKTAYSTRSSAYEDRANEAAAKILENKAVALDPYPVIPRADPAQTSVPAVAPLATNTYGPPSSNFASPLQQKRDLKRYQNEKAVALPATDTKAAIEARREYVDPVDMYNRTDDSMGLPTGPLPDDPRDFAEAENLKEQQRSDISAEFDRNFAPARVSNISTGEGSQLTLSPSLQKNYRSGIEAQNKSIFDSYAKPTETTQALGEPFAAEKTKRYDAFGDEIKEVSTDIKDFATPMDTPTSKAKDKNTNVERTSKGTRKAKPTGDDRLSQANFLERRLGIEPAKVGARRGNDGVLYRTQADKREADNRQLQSEQIRMGSERRKHTDTAAKRGQTKTQARLEFNARPENAKYISTKHGGSKEPSSKIVCSAMNNAYGFGSFRNKIWLKHSKNNLTKEHQVGYHRIFLPLIYLGYNKNYKIIRKCLEHIARHRTTDIYFQSKSNKRDILGMMYGTVLEPICYLVGLFTISKDNK